MYKTIAKTNYLQSQSFSVENKTLKAEVFAIYQQLKTAQLKFKGITDYYTAKEHNIRQQLYHTERMLAQYKELESEAQDSLHKMRVKFERERREWTAVREQMSVVLKSLQSQVQVNQDRANKAQVSWVLLYLIHYFLVS